MDPVRVVNLREVPFDETFVDPPYAQECVGLTARTGAKRLGFNVSALPPGAYSCPYHWHHREEEIFIVIAGKAQLRSPDGVQELREGDLVFCATGPSGAHQFYNHGNVPFRYFGLSNVADLDACEYPDSGKVLVRGVGRAMFRRADTVEYGLDEGNPRAHWPGTTA